MKYYFLFIIIFILIIGCSNNRDTEKILIGPIEQHPKIINEVKPMKLISPSFVHEADIPSDYTCDGADMNPQLIIEEIPENTESLVLIMDDPDAPGATWDHWIVFNIDPTTTQIPENTEPAGTAGKNSWGRAGYGGPCPPSGTHRYFFKIYALDKELDLPEDSDKESIQQAMQGHIIGEAVLMGKYQRS